jgi:hypothetical protein
MSEIVSKNDTYHLSQEYEKTLKEILNFLFAQIKQAGLKTNGEVIIQVGKGKNLYQSKLHQEPSLNHLQPKQIEEIQTALQNPSALKSTVNIFVGDELVYQVKDGQVLRDKLNLSSSFKEQQLDQTPEINIKFETEKMKANGRNLATAAKDLIAGLWKRREAQAAPDGTLTYQSGHYIFSCKNEQLSVVSKETNQEVLNNNGFTDNATYKDIKLMQKVELAAAKLKQEELQLEQPKFNLKMK